MRRNRITATIAAACMVMVLLTGCSSGEANTAKAGKDGNVTTEVTEAADATTTEAVEKADATVEPEEDEENYDTGFGSYTQI